MHYITLNPYLCFVRRAMRRIAMEQKGEDGDDDAEIVEEPEEEEEPPEEPQSEGLKQVVRGGPYSMCTRAGLGTDFR